jgi:hypothetical protein
MNNQMQTVSSRFNFIVLAFPLYNVFPPLKHQSGESLIDHM